MDPISRVVAAGAAGAGGAASAALYVDDVFSTYLYDGTGTAQTITNGIDLSGEGGLVWIKARSEAYGHFLYDTERGANERLLSNSTGAESTQTSELTSFNSTGFSLGTALGVNQSTPEYCSWTFRKAPGFFDVVTYTGDGTNDRNISHSLGSTPGALIIKRLDSSADWLVWHRSAGISSILRLNLTDAGSGGLGSSIPSNPTSSVFTVSSHSTANASGGTYVAYLFAHDDQSFGTGSDEAIIKCGGVTTGSDEYATVNLGFEPQFVMFKRTDTSGDWLMLDTMRGWNLGNDDKRLYANLTQAENTTSSGHGEVNSTGFRIYNLGGSADLIYIAIRRPHKPPSAGTDVFAAQDGRSASDGSASQSTYTSGFPVDMIMRHTKASDSTRTVVFDRLRGENYLLSHSTAVEASGNFILFDDMDGVYRSSVSANTGLFAHMFKRAPSFFDMVTYTGTGSDLTLNHNLGAVPELIICRNRSSGTGRWYVYPGPLSSSEQKHFRLNENIAVSSSASLDWAPTATTFNADTFLSLSTSSTTYIAYLFATLSGVSKVGTYSGTGNAINVDCGFAAGARFVLIKRTDSTGDWYVWDSTRGIVSGNDPYIELNTSDAQVTNTDYVDPLAAGFTVTSSAPAALNASGGTYLFLAIA